MVVQNDDQGKESRPPSVSDLVNLCRELNRHGAKQVDGFMGEILSSP